MRNLYGWRFAATVALPLLLASLGVTWLTFDLIGRVSTGANVADRQRTSEIVKSALGAAQNQLASMVADNSYWDDGVRQAYGPLNPDWLEETWGASTESGSNYDAFFIVDRAHPTSMAGYRKGSSFNPVLTDYFHGKLDSLLDLLPTGIATHDSKASIFNTREGLAIAAAAPILPTSDDLKIPGTTPRYLVFVRFLTPEYVQSIGEQYVIDGLKVEATASGADGEAVKATTGASIASVSWNDRRPGDAAGSKVKRNALLILSFLAIVMAGIALICWRLISTISAREDAARREALRDSLTGLPNRAGLWAEIEKLPRPGGDVLAVAFADLDGFKEVNDTYDHETGDRLIRAVAAGLSHLVGDTGTLCRLGGDEFVIVIHGHDAQSRACLLAKQAIEFLDQSFDLDGRMASVGASIGIAVASNGEIDSNELMRRADVAMYQAKSTGKNRYCQYAPEIDRQRNEDSVIADELRQILAAGALDVAYQPIVDSKTRAIVAVEALARWPSTSSKRVSPDKFVAIAEQQGLIDALGEAILAKACSDASQWPGVRLSANISPVQLRNPNFVQRTLQIIADSGIGIGRVELEITEGSLVTDFDAAKRMFIELRLAGLHIALDDFGTGFSSIGYLRQFNFDRIKIDRSLVNCLLSGSAEQHIVQGAMLMASGLSATVTAEGVEREDQIDILRMNGCDELQGFFFFKPMPAQHISNLLSEPAALQAIQVA